MISRMVVLRLYEIIFPERDEFPLLQRPGGAKGNVK